jgi:spore coat protein U-like protein
MDPKVSTPLVGRLHSVQVRCLCTRLQGNILEAMKRPIRLTTRRAIRLIILGLGLLAAGWGAAAPALAATATSSLSVTATVSATCTISSSAVAFGAYDPVSANTSTALDGTGTVTVTCTSGGSTTITLGQGSNANTGSTDAVPLRRMNVGTAFLSYFLYSESGRTTVWGNTAGTGVAHTGTGTATAITVYGRTPAGQNVPPGSYVDTVVATITFYRRPTHAALVRPTRIAARSHARPSSVPG